MAKTPVKMPDNLPASKKPDIQRPTPKQVPIKWPHPAPKGKEKWGMCPAPWFPHRRHAAPSLAVVPQRGVGTGRPPAPNRAPSFPPVRR